MSGKLWPNSMIMQDVETNSLWSHVAGEGLAGERHGAVRTDTHEEQRVLQSFWFAWSNYFPNTVVVD